MKKFTLLLLLFTLNVLLVKAQTYFGTQQIISTDANYPQKIDACDIDGDGDIDILSASFFDNKIAWYENDGTGTFGIQNTISVDITQATSAYGCDLDGDNDLDIIATSSYDSTIVWFENINGLGSFGPKVDIAKLSGGPSMAYPSDIDGDGDTDVIVTQRWEDKIVWFENTDGNGTFGAEQIITTTAKGPNSIYPSDLDGDGDQDILASWNKNVNVVWYENTDGLGTFSNAQMITTNLYFPSSVFAADIDGDNDLDVLSASENDSLIAWYENTDGNGSFGPLQVITNRTPSAKSVYGADLDNDGDVDVISAHNIPLAGDKVCWYENTDGKGSFGNQKLISDQCDMLKLAIAEDIDGDGINDVISASASDDKIAWYKSYPIQFTAQPSDRNVSCNSNTNFYVSAVNVDTYQWQVDEGLGFYDLINNATYSGVDNDILEITNATIDMRDYKYVCIATSAGGSRVSDTATLIIDDIESPVVTSSHPDLTVDANNHCIAYITDYKSSVIATDNCDADLDITQSPVPGQTLSGTTNPVTLTVTDDLGNFTEITFNIAVVDNTSPWVSSTHNDQVINADVNCEATVPNYIGEVIANDNCDTDLQITQSPIPGRSIIGSTNPVTLTITDDNGNITEKTFNIEVADNTNPVLLSTHNDQTVDANINCEASLPDYTTTVSATDNCDASLDIVQSPVAGITIAGSANPVTLTITDDAGNFVETTFNVAVTDNSAPVITSVHTDKAVADEGSCQATLPDYTGTVTATDNCDLSLDITQSPVAGTIVSGYTNPVTLSATDNLGNISEVTFNVSVTDNTNPVISSTHSDQTLDFNENCEGILPDYTGDVIANDNCDINLDISQSPVAGTAITGLSNEVVLIASDDAGNFADVSFNVEVSDNTDPIIISVHNDDTLDADASFEATIPDYTLDVVATDNCDTYLDITQNPLPGTIISGSLNIITLTAIDDAANFTQTTFNVEVADLSPPVISSTHSDQAVSDEGNCEATLADYTVSVLATDICDPSLDVTQTPVAGTKIQGSTNNITLTVTDNAGNFAAVSFNVEVIDNTNPVITSVHNNQTVDANSNCEALLTDYTAGITATDNCDTDLDITQNPVAGTVISGSTNTITLTVTDDAGNTAETNFNVQVVDNTNPVITSTHNDLVISDEGSCEAILPDYTGDVVATDICDSELDITQSPEAGSTVFGAINEVTLTATDDAGNYAEVKFNVGIEDNMPPVITSDHSNQTIDANSNCEALLPDYTGDVVANDQCDTEPDIVQLPAGGTIITGTTNEITISVTDDAGNDSEVTFNVRVEDNNDPAITCVGNQSFDLASDNSVYTVSGTLLDPVLTTDNCNIESISNDYNESNTLNGAEFLPGSTTVVWTITDGSGNTANCSFDVTVNESLGIENLKKHGISIYPNPTSGLIYIESTKFQIERIEVYDLIGKLIIRKIEFNDNKIDLSKYNNEIFIIKITTVEKTFTTRILKK